MKYADAWEDLKGKLERASNENVEAMVREGYDRGDATAFKNCSLAWLTIMDSLEEEHE